MAALMLCVAEPAFADDVSTKTTGFLQKIIDFLKAELTKMDNLIAKAQSVIQLMQERRTTLISSAVTGKIDVRHHASRPSGNDKKQTEGI